MRNTVRFGYVRSPAPCSTLFPYTTLFRSHYRFIEGVVDSEDLPLNVSRETVQGSTIMNRIQKTLTSRLTKELVELAEKNPEKDRKSTRLNSSHVEISYAVFCLKKKSIDLS